MDAADLVAIEMDDTRLGLENTIPLRAAKDFCKCITRHIEFRDKQLLTSQRERERERESYLCQLCGLALVLTP